MTFNPTVLLDCRLYLDGADLTGYSNKAQLSAKANDLDSTVFSSTSGSNVYKSRVAGLFEGDAQLDGFYQAGDLSQPDDAIWANLGLGSTALTALPTGTNSSAGNVGDIAYVLKALECDYKPGGKVGELLAWTLDAKTNGPMARGKIFHPQGTARTVTGNGTGIQLGAVSAAQRLYANLHVLSYVDGSLTVAVQSSVDNTFGAPTTRLTFNAATALGGQALSVLGPVTDTWWRVTWTISGGVTHSFLFAAALGIGPK